MKDQVAPYIIGFSAATVTVLGAMLHEAMHIKATPRASVSPATTQFTCSIVEDLTDKGDDKSCCWDEQCARFPVRPY